MKEKDIKIEDEETLNEEPVEETDKEAEAKGTENSETSEDSENSEKSEEKDPLEKAQEEITELKLKNKELEYQKCQKFECTRRLPPRFFVCNNKSENNENQADKNS